MRSRKSGTKLPIWALCTMDISAVPWASITMGGRRPSTGSWARPSGKLVKGRVAINVDGFMLDLGTLGGPNSWDNPFGGEINDRGEAVGYSETAVPDPDGEDVCGFGTHLTCRPFLWQNYRMSALPMLGGNNGQASAMNNRGQVTGFAETTVSDSSCPASAPSKIDSPVIWEDGKVRALPTVGSDPDGEANGINDQGQAAGYSGTCTASLHAVLWEKSGTASSLPDLGTAGSSFAFGVNNQGQIVGEVASPDGTTFYAALWQNGAITNLRTLPGDFAAIASGINNQGQVVGSTLDASFNWSHAFVWQDGVMTDLNTLFPASSNLYATMANSINSVGQIVGMATVLSGPHAGETHDTTGMERKSLKGAWDRRMPSGFLSLLQEPRRPGGFLRLAEAP